MEISGKNYELVYSLRSMFVFEEIAGKAFSIDTLMDTYIFFYSCIVANQNNPKLEFNEFIDAADADPSLLTQFNEFMNSESKKRELLQSKKKVTKKGRPRKN